jgi:signal transduction histidine kinase
MTKLMEAVAKLTGSAGCILWRQRKSNRSEIILMAGWFEREGPLTLCRANIDGTCAGSSLFESAQECTPDNNLVENKNPYASHPFLISHGINKTLACKVVVSKGNGTIDQTDHGDDPAWVGSLSLFRRGNRPSAPAELVPQDDFNSESESLLKEICGFLPFLFRAARDREALRLFQETAKIVSDYEPPAKPEEWGKNLKTTVRKFGTALQRAFRSLEVSVFLRNLKDPTAYSCWYTTDGVHWDTTLGKNYKGGLDEGFSGLCLLQEEPIRVADIRHPQAEEQIYKDLHRGFKGHPSNGISAMVLEESGLSDAQAPPHSMIWCRLSAGAEVLGFVRCRIVLEGPVLFQQEDGDLLRQVTESFSKNFDAWWEAHRWEDSMQKVAGYTGRGKGDKQHLVEALELVERAVPGADVNTVRLLDSSGDYLEFAAYSTKAREELEAQYAQNGLNKRFRVQPPLEINTVGADVIQTHKGERFPTSDPRYQHLFKGIKEGIVVPIIGHDDTLYGVLDARARTGFPPYALRMLEIIGRLVGSQHALRLKAVEDQKIAAAAMSKEIKHYRDQIAKEKQHVEAFEDAAHQIKTPLHAAMKLIEISGSYGRKPNMVVLETSLRRADLASKLMNTFADIAAGHPLDLRHSELTPEAIAKLIRTLMADVLRSSEESRGLKFEFDEDCVLKHAPRLLEADAKLLAEAIYNLIENAEKYSHPRTQIRCYAGRSQKGRFFISVTNKGERIEGHEVNLCKQRRWRKPTLGHQIGSGSGLGLYIVDKIMIAHRGKLNVIPTTDEGVTEVRLEFPVP